MDAQNGPWGPAGAVVGGGTVVALTVVVEGDVLVAASAKPATGTATPIAHAVTNVFRIVNRVVMRVSFRG
jgi:N-acetylglucosamine kinase-like BadF-type ATPase